nr:hypothetical protein [Tanacetum cinerariifolium]
ENNLDYAEELARLQRQEYEAHSAVAKPGFEFSVDTTTLLPQAEIEIRRNLVPAAGDPVGSIVSTGGFPAGSVPASGVPAGSVPASSVPASGVLAGSIVSTGGVPAGSVPASGVPAGSVPASSVLASGVLTGSIVSVGFASNVAVDPVATKRVNTIHPQSQIIRALQSPVQTQSTVQKSKFSESAFISYVHHQNRTNHADHLHCLFACFLSQLEPISVAKALEDPDWVAAMQEEMQQFYNQQVWTLVPLPDGKIAIGTK